MIKGRLSLHNFFLIFIKKIVSFSELFKEQNTALYDFKTSTSSMNYIDGI